MAQLRIRLPEGSHAKPEQAHHVPISLMTLDDYAKSLSKLAEVVQNELVDELINPDPLIREMLDGYLDKPVPWHRRLRYRFANWLVKAALKLGADWP
jgi:hypothetical protein